MEVLTNISAIMDEKRLFQKDLAEGLGIAISGVSHLLHGNRELKLKDLAKIAKVLGVREIDILTYPDVYEKKAVNNYIVSEPPPIYEKTEKAENPYKLLYELQKEMTEMVQENERLKNDAAIGKIAKTA